MKVHISLSFWDAGDWTESCLLWRLKFPWKLDKTACHELCFCWHLADLKFQKVRCAAFWMCWCFYHFLTFQQIHSNVMIWFEFFWFVQLNWFEQNHAKQKGTPNQQCWLWRQQKPSWSQRQQRLSSEWFFMHSPWRQRSVAWTTVMLMQDLTWPKVEEQGHHHFSLRNWAMCLRVLIASGPNMPLTETTKGTKARRCSRHFFGQFFFFAFSEATNQTLQLICVDTGLGIKILKPDVKDGILAACNTLICLQLALHRASSCGTHRVVTHSRKTRFSAHRTSCY